MGDYEGAISLEARVAPMPTVLNACLVQPRDYRVQGYADVQDWIDGCWASLKTEAARNLADACLQVESSARWQGLKKLTNKK